MLLKDKFLFYGLFSYFNYAYPRGDTSTVWWKSRGRLLMSWQTLTSSSGLRPDSLSCPRGSLQTPSHPHPGNALTLHKIQWRLILHFTPLLSSYSNKFGLAARNKDNFWPVFTRAIQFLLFGSVFILLIILQRSNWRENTYIFWYS